MKRRAWLVAFIGPGLMMLLFLCHSWFGPDIWYHLTWGRSLVTTVSFLPTTQTLIPQPIFANTYWLFQSLIYLSYQTGGPYLVSFIFAFVWLAIFTLWLKLSGLWRHALGPWLSLGFVICCQLRFEHRPESFSYLLLMIFLWRLCAVDL